MVRVTVKPERFGFLMFRLGFYDLRRRSSKCRMCDHVLQVQVQVVPVIRRPSNTRRLNARLSWKNAAKFPRDRTRFVLSEGNWPMNIAAVMPVVVVWSESWGKLVPREIKNSSSLYRYLIAISKLRLGRILTEPGPEQRKGSESWG